MRDLGAPERAPAGLEDALGSRPLHGGGPVRRALVRAAQLALTVAVTWYIVERLGPGLGQLARGEAGDVHPRWAWIAASCVALALGYAASAWIWGRMVADLGGPRLPAGESVRVFMVANLGRYLPGKVWQIAGLAVLGRSRGVPPAVATAAGLVGQAISLAGAMLIGMLALAHAAPPVDRFAPLAVAATAAVVLTVTVPGIFGPLLRLGLRWVPGEKPADIRIGAAAGAGWLALYTLNWGGYALAFWLLLRGLSLPGGPLVVGPAFVAAYVIGYVALFAPAGLGVREGAMAVLLTPAVGAGAAALVALVARVWMTLVEVVPAGAFWLAEMARGRRRA